MKALVMLVGMMLIVGCEQDPSIPEQVQHVRLVVDDSSSAGIDLRLLVPNSLLDKDRVDVVASIVSTTMQPTPTRVLRPTTTDENGDVTYSFTVPATTTEIQIGGYRNGDFTADISVTRTFGKPVRSVYDSLLHSIQDAETDSSSIRLRRFYEGVLASRDTTSFREDVLAAVRMALGRQSTRDVVNVILTSHASCGVLDSWKFSSILLWCISELNTSDGAYVVRAIYRAFPLSYFARAYDYLLREGLQAEDVTHVFNTATRILDADSALALRCFATTLTLRNNDAHVETPHVRGVAGITRALTMRYRQGGMTPLLVQAYSKRQLHAWAELKTRTADTTDTAFAEPMQLLESTFSPMDPRLGSLYDAVGRGHRIRGNTKRAAYYFAAACRISPSQRVYRNALASSNAGRSSDEDVSALCTQAETLGIIAKRKTAYALPMSIRRHVQRTDKPVFLVFVSETCAPCQQLLVEIGSSLERFDNANIVIVPIGEWRTSPQAKYSRFTFASLADIHRQFARSMHIQATPSVVLFNADNNFVQRIDGKPSIKTLVNAVQQSA